MRNIFRKKPRPSAPSATSEAQARRMEFNVSALAAAKMQRDVAVQKLQEVWAEHAEHGLPMSGSTAARALEANAEAAEALVMEAARYASLATVPRFEDGLPMMFRFTARDAA